MTPVWKNAKKNTPHPSKKYNKIDAGKTLNFPARVAIRYMISLSK